MQGVDVRNISLGEIFYFVKVVEYGNITQAAEVLFLSQSTLSKKIASLESQIGLQLFVRGKNKRLRVTSVGQYLYDRWKGVPLQIEKDLQEAHLFQSGYERSVVIGTIDSFRPELFVMPLVDSFTARYPNIHLHIKTGSAQQIRQQLLQGDVDVIFSIPCDFEGRGQGNIGWRLFEAEQPCFVGMLKSSPLARRETLRIQDLRDSTFVCSSPQELPGYTDKVRRICATQGFVPKIKKYVSADVDLSLNLMSDDEVFLCNYYYYDQTESRLCYRPLEGTTSGFVLAWREDSEDLCRDLFLEHCIQQLEQKN